MAKLKFDRSISLDLKSNNTMVPKDEVWKVTIGVDIDKNTVLDINNARVYNTSNINERNINGFNATLGGVLESLEPALLQGLRSKLLARIFAKEVSLA